MSGLSVLFAVSISIMGAVISQDDYCFQNSCNRMNFKETERGAGQNRIREEFLSGGSTKTPHVSRKLTNTGCSKNQLTLEKARSPCQRAKRGLGSVLSKTPHNQTVRIKGSKKKRKKLKRKNKARRRYKDGLCVFHRREVTGTGLGTIHDCLTTVVRQLEYIPGQHTGWPHQKEACEVKRKSEEQREAESDGHGEKSIKREKDRYREGLAMNFGHTISEQSV